MHNSTIQDDALISAQNISLTLQGQSILHSVSLNVNSHDFITIVGPNGAGKSTLLKLLMGLQQPTKGHIFRSEALKIGYVPQRFQADPSMPIQCRRFLKLNYHGDEALWKSTINDLNIHALLDKPMDKLSGGELQRILLARALLKEPNLLVLDEPAQSLDITGQMHFYRLLDRLYQSRNISIVMVSHDLHLVMASSHQVVCLYHHICCSGTPQVVAKSPEFVELFGDEMADLMAVYHHHHDHTHEDGACHVHGH